MKWASFVKDTNSKFTKKDVDIQFPPAFYFTHGNVHVSMLVSLFVPYSPFPTESTSLLPMSASP